MNLNAPNLSFFYSLMDTSNIIYDELRVTHTPPQGEATCTCGHCNIFKDIILQLVNKPRSLKQICRLVIRESLDGQLIKAGPEIGLPPAMIEYLKSFTIS